MKAYKFRAEQQFNFALDIIYNRELYCADWRTLNDPMEGLFTYTPVFNDPLVDARVADVVSGKQSLRVCSLSATYQSHLLWAHYASGFSGLAVEIEFPERERELRHEPIIQKVIYSKDFSHITVGDDDQSAEDRAVAVLSSKYSEWQYEQEIRLLHRSPKISLTECQYPITRVIVGHRMNPALCYVVELLCQNQQIPLYQTQLASATIELQPLYECSPQENPVSIS